jgi:SAM-dependent methyltransferase
MQHQKMLASKGIFSRLVNFCSQQRPDVEIERINNSLGKLVYSEGEVYTVENVDSQRCRYRLIPVAYYNGEFSGVTDANIHEITELGGSKLEFLALNLHMFSVFPDEKWSGWNPVGQKDGHEQIYQQILRTLQSYTSGGERVLVVGCGEGSFLNTLSKAGYEARGIDPNKRNIEFALAQGRNVQHGKIEDIEFEVDVIIEPGVLSAGVVDRSYVRLAVRKLASTLSDRGILIHAPFSRSLMCFDDLTANGFDVLNMTVPPNLFTYDHPKQFYVAQKN